MSEEQRDEVVEETGVATLEEGEAGKKMDLKVAIDDVGPCKKHIRVSVPRASIDEAFEELLGEYVERAEVPGFRPGHVPVELVRKRFRKDLNEQVKQRVLMQSLEQLGAEAELNPINEPNLDLESIELPEEGDFEYEFDIEVRPTFDLPEYLGLEIERPSREVSEEDVTAYLNQFMEQYGKLVPVSEAAQAGDFVTLDIDFTHNGKPISHLRDHSVRVRPTLRFQDAELSGFDKLMVGASADDTRECELTVSMEADTVAMRGETVRGLITVLDVKRMETPELDDEFLGRMGIESEEQLREQVRSMLERQVKYEQRQACRRQVLEKITDSATWDLPEDLVSRQVENALRREILEMQQAGFTSQEIRARENDLRQRSVSMTRQNLKEHFILDRVAEQEKIEVGEQDIDVEITMMAMQRGENPRRVRSRMIKSGMIDNLEAQIRERKAVDVILDNAKFTDKPMPDPTETTIEAVNRSVCRQVQEADADSKDEDGDDE
ncbi:MAG: trigger factor [Planctomycetaceae bacterium]|nr:trigger factor [Planctomycetaceae bacterium]